MTPQQISDIIARADVILRAHKGSGMLRHEDLIRDMRDALVQAQIMRTSDSCP